MPRHTRSSQIPSSYRSRSLLAYIHTSGCTRAHEVPYHSYYAARTALGRAQQHPYQSQLGQKSGLILDRLQMQYSHRKRCSYVIFPSFLWPTMPINDRIEDVTIGES
jgi:hypothetical protein